MSDRDELIRWIADFLAVDPSWELPDLAEVVTEALDALGLAVVPVTVPAEEGSEATHTAERAVLNAAHRVCMIRSTATSHELHIALNGLEHAVRAVAVETEETPT